MTKRQLQHELTLAREEIHALRHKLKIYDQTARDWELFRDTFLEMARENIEERNRLGARCSSYWDKLERYRLTVTRLENLLKDNGIDPYPPPVK